MSRDGKLKWRLWADTRYTSHSRRFVTLASSLPLHPVRGLCKTQRTTLNGVDCTPCRTSLVVSYRIPDSLATSRRRAYLPGLCLARMAASAELDLLPKYRPASAVSSGVVGGSPMARRRSVTGSEYHFALPPTAAIAFVRLASCCLPVSLFDAGDLAASFTMRSSSACNSLVFSSATSDSRRCTAAVWSVNAGATTAIGSTGAFGAAPCSVGFTCGAEGAGIRGVSIASFMLLLGVDVESAAQIGVYVVSRQVIATLADSSGVYFSSVYFESERIRPAFEQGSRFDRRVQLFDFVRHSCLLRASRRRLALRVGLLGLIQLRNTPKGLSGWSGKHWQVEGTVQTYQRLTINIIQQYLTFVNSVLYNARLFGFERSDGCHSERSHSTVRKLSVWQLTRRSNPTQTLSSHLSNQVEYEPHNHFNSATWRGFSPRTTSKYRFSALCCANSPEKESKEVWAT